MLIGHGPTATQATTEIGMTDKTHLRCRKSQDRRSAEVVARLRGFVATRGAIDSVGRARDVGHAYDSMPVRMGVSEDHSE